MNMFIRQRQKRQETHHEMRIPERDVSVICLLTYAYLYISTEPKLLPFPWISMDKRK